MAFKVRIQYADAISRVMNRGDRREAIFFDNVERRCFLQTPSETCEKTGWSRFGIGSGGDGGTGHPPAHLPRDHNKLGLGS